MLQAEAQGRSCTSQPYPFFEVRVAAPITNTVQKLCRAIGNNSIEIGAFLAAGVSRWGAVHAPTVSVRLGL